MFLYDILKKLSAKLCLDVSGFGFCLDLLHFVSLLTSLCCGLLSYILTLMAYTWLTFMGNRPKLADWSKLVCITPRSCLYSFLTSNWEVNADLSLNRFLIISQIVQLFVIGSYIEGIETNLRIEKHTLRVFT